MRKGKNLAFLVAIIYVIALLTIVIGIPPLAATAAEDAGNKVTATTGTTVKQGDTGYCYVYIDSLESLSSLNVAVHYDPDKISVTSSFNQVNCSIYDSSVGESYVQYSYIFDGNGEDVKTNLFYFEYKVLKNAELGKAYFDVVVSEAYDSSLNVADVSGSRCNFTIAETVITKSCNISGVSSVASSVKEEFELSYRLNTTGVASGSFVIRYDPELFAFVELTQREMLSNKVVDINTDLPGAIYVSFVGTAYANSTQLLQVKFKTIKNVTETSQIKLSVMDFYDLELNSISCYGYTTTVNVAYDPLYSENAPIMSVTPVYSAENNNVTLTIRLAEGSHLGAGDFVLHFDTEYFTYRSSEKGFSPSFFNVNDKKASEGILKFSIISLSDIVSEETVLTVVLDTPVFCNDTTAKFDLQGSGLADSMTNAIVLNFVDAALSISGVGHDEIPHAAQAPTCTEIGWYAYDTCSRCDYTTYVEIPANGHSYVHTLCAVCGEKQPTYKSWDVSAAKDGSLLANLYQNLVDGGYELEIVGTGAMIDWGSTSRVPYDGYRTQINYLTIENGVTSIGAYAFSNMAGVAAVTIPDSVETIGLYAFNGCTGLSALTFGNSVEIIGNYAFNGCTALTEVSLPDSTKTIGNYAFYSCENFSTLSLGDAVTTVGTYAFGNCSGLTELTIPENVTSIGNNAFYNCTALTRIQFNATAMNDLFADNCVFYNAGMAGDGITMTVGQNVTRIPAYLCSSTGNASNMPKLVKVLFQEGSVCETIGARAFYTCSDLVEIRIADSVHTIDVYAFNGCTSLALVQMPTALTTIGSYAFSGCTGLTEIEIPENVTSVGENAFYNCTALTRIQFNATAMNDLPANNYVFGKAGINGNGITMTIGQNVTRIPGELFRPYTYNTSNQPKIVGVVFEAGSACQTIGSSAFYGCSELTEIEIPENVTSVGKYAFYNCKALTRIAFNATAMDDLSSNNYVFYNAGNEGSGLTVTIGRNVTKIPAYLFYPVGGAAKSTKITHVIFEEGSVCQSIGTNACYRCTDLTEIEIPNSVHTIGAYAFAGCTSLTLVQMPAALTAIGNYAFSDCTGLLEIEIPVNVTSVGEYAFYNCKVLTRIAFNATAMDDFSSNNNVFYYAGNEGSGITVTIGRNVTKIPAYLFNPNDNLSGCPQISSLTIEEGSACQTIGAAAFRGCSWLTEIEIPANITSIGNYAFSNCSGLTRIVFNATAMNDVSSNNRIFQKAGLGGNGITVSVGQNVTRIPAYLFYLDNNSALEQPVITSLIFEEGAVCQTIGAYAFSDNSWLAEIEIPENVTSIENYAFSNCAALTRIVFNATAMNDFSSGNFVFQKAGGNRDGIAVTIGQNVTKIPAFLFNPNDYSSGCPKISSLTFEEGSVCKSIGAYAFYRCQYLSEFMLPEGLETIGNNAFYYNERLLQVMIPDTVTRIGDYAFYGCDKAIAGFASDTLPAELGTSWKSSGLAYYLNVKQFMIVDDALYVVFNDHTAVFAKYYGAEDSFQIRGTVAGATVTSIEKNAFRGNTNLKTVSIPASVTQIGAYAFSGCSALTEIEIPDLVHTIDTYAFANCTSLTQVQMPAALTTIGTNAFSGCSALTEIEIPENVTFIGNYAFISCKALTRIAFNATALKDFATDNFVFGRAGNEGSGITVTIGRNVTKIPTYLFYPSSSTDVLPKITNVIFEEGSVCEAIGTFAFYGCTGLTEIKLADSVRTIDTYAFANCTSLTQVQMPTALTTIGSYAFYGCTGLTEIEIPQNVTAIGSYAFYNCKALSRIAFNATAISDLSADNYVFGSAGSDGSGVTVTIGQNVTRIPGYLFYPYRYDTSTLPKIVRVIFEDGSVCEAIGTYAFYGCSGLTELEIPENVTSIGTYAFYRCTGLTEIKLADSVRTIDAYAFANCTSLTQVQMPTALTTIGSYAFSGCTGLTEIVIPESVTSIGSCAFKGAGQKRVYIYSQSIARNATSATTCGYLLSGVTSVVVPENIGQISTYIQQTFPFTEEITYQGKECIAYSTHEHSWCEHQTLVTRIPCVQDGCVRYICSDCGICKDVTFFRHDVVINAAKEPDCTNVGWHEYHTCALCDYTTYIEIPALGHRVLNDERIWVDSITTENDGTYPFIFKDGAYNSANKSDNTDSYFKITALYDCTLHISYAVSSEANYDRLIIRKNDVIQAEVSGQADWASIDLELVAGDVVTINYHKDSSQAHFEDTGWFRYSCEQTAIGELVLGPAEDAEPTCTEAVVCHFCQKLIKEALGHDEISHDAKEPTCTEIGWHAYVTCSRCDYTTYEERAATGHSYGDWVETLAPTCTTIGSARRDCDNCDHYETRDVAALGHDEVTHNAQAPTCTDIGWHAYVTCSRCEYTTYEELPATGHTFGSWTEAQAPTCTTMGTDRRDCNNCDHYETRDVNALGHDEIGHAAKDPTCTTIGWFAYDTCSRCDYTTYVERAALGHDEITHDAQAPTCTEIGWNAFVTCSRCDYSTYEPLAATGHSYVRTVCSSCGEAQPVLNTWDVSADGDGSLMAKLYKNYVEGGYELVITGSGAMTDYQWGTAPWYSYSYSYSITRLELPEGLTKIGDHAFVYCSALRQVTVPDSVESIGDRAFDYCGKLVIVFAGDQLPQIPSSGIGTGYSYFLSPQKVVLTENATYVIDKDGNAWLAKYVGNENAFVALESVDGIPLTRIAQYAFYQNNNLRTYWIEEKITYIGLEAFNGCGGLAILLESDTLPAYTASSWNGGCSYYLGAETWMEDEFLFVRDASDRVDLLYYMGSAEEVTVPSHPGGYPLTNIRKYAFANSSVKSVILPEGILSIEGPTFRNCSLLQSIQLPQSLTKIGEYAFENCYSLAQIQLPENLTYIGSYAFWECRKLKTIVIPEGVTSLDGTFVNCYALETVTLHDDITSIGGMTFYGCRSLKELRLPKKLQSFGYATFYDCKALHELVIPENVHKVDWSTVFQSTNLDVLYISSPRLAASLTESDLSSSLFQALKTLVVPAEGNAEMLQSRYPHCETIQRDGVAYHIYSRNAHEWNAEILVEYVICQTDGVILYTCGNCGVEKLEITSCHDKLQHNAQAATCTGIGWDAYETCSRCDYSTYVEIPATGHSYGQWEETLAPTCTLKGTERRDCDACDHYETRDVNPLGHDEVAHDGKAVTCTTIGWNAYVTCSRCDYSTYAEIPATGHTYGDWAQTLAPTCLTTGTDRRDCIHGDHYETREVKALGHDEVSHSPKAATCTAVGWDAYVTCSRCDYSTYAEIPATGHTSSDWIIDEEATYEADGAKHKECTVCHEILENSSIPMLTHSYVSVVTPPTCTQQGYTTHTCSDCGSSYVDNLVPATGHNYGQWNQTQAPQCESVGTERRDCSVCDHYETRDVAATGHTSSDWIVDSQATCTVNGSKHKECIVCEKVLTVESLTKLGHDEVGHVAKAPTCTAIGWDTYVTCSRCDYSTYAEIPAKGHVYGEWIAEIPATCEEEGTLGHYHCTFCDTDFDTDKNILASLVISATGHTQSDWIVDSRATCTVNGSKHKECTVCEKVLSTDVIEMLGHDTVNHPAKEPTCTAIGWNAYDTCARCDYSTYAEIPAKGHDYGSWIPEVPATCEEEGTLGHYHCTACGLDFDTGKNVLASLVISATGHTQSDWIVDSNATCTTDGSKHKACTVCGKTLETQTITKLGHDEVGHYAKAATCTAIGWEAYVTCSRCDYSTYAEIPATGHTYGEWTQTLAPTCLTTGIDRRDCIHGDHYETREVKALGHDEVSHSPKAATCTAIGWEAYVTCSRCDYSTYAEIPATGHTYGDWAQTLAPTCLTAGMDRRDCIHGDHYETREVKALGHDEVSHSPKAATCTAIGWDAYVTCSRCDYSTYAEIPATGHTYGDWAQTLAPTCLTTGMDRRDCIHGDHYETREVKALGHDEVSHSPKAATCTAIGWDAYVTCSRCDYSTYAEIPATGHTYGEWTQTLAPTCLTTGMDRRDCIHGDHYETREVKALGHDEVSHSPKAATCTAIGWDAYVTCSRCDYSTYAEIPATGHTFARNDKHTCDVCRYSETPDQPMLESKTHNSITLQQREGFEYSMDGIVWQSSNVFDDLLPSTTYTFYQRVKASANALVSETSSALEVETDEEPTYTIVFRDWDGTILSSQTYHHGDQVAVPAAPTRAADNMYTYVFAAWDSEVVNCVTDATYTAVYTAHFVEYTIVFRDWDGAILSTQTYHWNDAVTPPSAPNRKADEKYTYAFAGWDTPVINCTGNATYMATYTATYIDYTVEFKDWNGNLISTKTYHYGDQVTVPADPTRAADNTYTYVFSGWDAAVVNCAGNVTYTATYVSTYIEYTVEFKDWNGTILSTKTYHWGVAVTAPANPARPADHIYVYTFTGWDTEVTGCTGNKSYIAVYTQGYKDYTVVFKNWDGSVLSTKTYHWGDKVTAPKNPTRPSDDVYVYTFTGWDKTVVACNGNAVYTAAYSKQTKVPSVITSPTYVVGGTTISKIAVGTTISTLVGKLNEGRYVKVYQGDKEVSGNALIGTGMVVKIVDNGTVKATYTIVVTGDTNGDGKISVTDMLAAKAHLLKKNSLQGAPAQAADTNGDGGISITDFIQMKAQILGKSNVEPKAVTATAQQVKTVSAEVQHRSADNGALAATENTAVSTPVRENETVAVLNDKQIFAVVPDKRAMLTV